MTLVTPQAGINGIQVGAGSRCGNQSLSEVDATQLWSERNAKLNPAIPGSDSLVEVISRTRSC